MRRIWRQRPPTQFAFTVVSVVLRPVHQTCGGAALILAVLGGLTGIEQSQAATGIVAIDRPSIAVKAPARVMLDAITLAIHRLVAVGEHGVIIYSDDNGQNWTQAQVPVNATLTTVGFASAKEGWAAGNSGVILHSSDGGKTWSLQLNGVQANQLTLVAAQEAQANKSNVSGAPLAVKRAQRLIEIGPSIPFLSILPLNPEKVIAFGAYRMTMITHDGGKDWADCSLNIGDPFSHHLYGSVSVGSNIFVVGEAGLVFRSTDGGNNFPLISEAGSATLFGIVAVHDGSLLAYGIAGLLFRSKDFGVSWTRIAMPQSADITAAATLSSGAIVLASESGSLYISRDDGLTFQSLLSRAPMALYAIIQGPDGNLVMAGSQGIMTLPSDSLTDP